MKTPGNKLSTLIPAAAGLLGVAAVVFALCFTGGTESGSPDGDSPARAAAAPLLAKSAKPGEAGWVFSGDMPPMKATTPEEVREVFIYARDSKADNIPTLRTMALRSEDPLVAGNAIKALGRMNALSGDRELLALLDDDRPRIRQEMVNAIGLSGDADLVDMLVPLLDSSEAGLRPLVIQALGRIGGETAKERLEIIARSESASRTDRVFVKAALDSLGSENRRRTAVKPDRVPHTDDAKR